MNFNPAIRKSSAAKRARRAFTLAEVLAAMLFMAIVIPVAVQGLRTASLAGEVGQRKVVAARIGNKILNELKVTGQLLNSSRSGIVTENGIKYNWSVHNQNWTEDPTTPMSLATLKVTFAAQGRNYDVNLSTLLSQNTGSPTQ
jgi:type II secretory pathway pseudopilin PulG